jgi:hypothetical protein
MSTKSNPPSATKVSPAEANADPEKLLRLTVEMAGVPEAEAQAIWVTWPTCPGCGTQYRNLPQSDHYQYFQCPKCGTYFKI